MKPDKGRFLLELQESLGGAITFERWMQEALYHPDFGYYTATIRGIGRRGDFTTWPLLHRSLATGIARWALAHRLSRRWHLIEIGAGTGELAAAVLQAIGWWNRPSYHIVDVSGPLREQQKQRLGRKVTWHDSMNEALASCDGQAVIFSNELVDAFPCRILQFGEDGWSELSLRIAGGRWEEIWKAVEAPNSSVADHPWPTGQRVEVQASYRRWLESWRPSWRQGTMLTIDYGDRCPDLYHRRPGGTLRAYAHHQRLEGADAYAGFGLRDLTVDVNFSDLLRWGPAGNGSLSSLGEFLGDTPPQLAEAGVAFQVLVETASPAPT